MIITLGAYFCVRATDLLPTYRKMFLDFSQNNSNLKKEKKKNFSPNFQMCPS